MKKTIISIAIILLTLILLATTSNATFQANIKSNVSTTKIGETVTLTISTNEKIVASNFSINYDSTAFKLEGSETSNLSVAEKEGKIACIYADISGAGTQEFKIKFKAQKETTSSNFKIENAKFRAEGQETSYTGTQISGIEQNVTVKVEKTTGTSTENGAQEENKESVTGKEEEKTKVESETGNKTTIKKDNTATSKTALPKAGKTTGIIVAVIIALTAIAVVLGKKSKELSKIFSSISIFVIVFVSVASFNMGVNADDDSDVMWCTAFMYNGYTWGSTAAIMLGKAYEGNSITVDQYLNSGIKYNIDEVEDSKYNKKNGNDLLKTGDIFKVGVTSYMVVLFGDANGDGIVCDTDDLMIIINDYLGKSTNNITELTRLAANLDNRDIILDADDLTQMIKMHLGILRTPIVRDVPKSNINPGTENLPELWTESRFGDYVYYCGEFWRVYGCEDVLKQPECYQVEDMGSLEWNGITEGQDSFYVWEEGTVLLLPNKPFLVGKFDSNSISNYCEDPTKFINIYDKDYAKGYRAGISGRQASMIWRVENSRTLTTLDRWYHDDVPFWGYFGTCINFAGDHEMPKDSIDANYLSKIGVMPMIELKNGIKIQSGDGSINNAYTIAPIKDNYPASSQQ